MACKWMEAREGYKWEPSVMGRKDPRIYSKFSDDYINKKQYERKVPESWFRYSYVRQVKVEDSKCQETV